jgi:hypothetical protein
MKFVIEMRLIAPKSTTIYWYAGTTAEASHWVINRRGAVTLTCRNADALIERLHDLVRARGHHDISFHRQPVE